MNTAKLVDIKKESVATMPKRRMSKYRLLCILIYMSMPFGAAFSLYITLKYGGLL